MFFIRSAVNINEPFRTLRNRGFLPARSRLISFATRVTIPCEISFVKLASYQGVSSTGVIKEVIGITEDLTDRTVVIVEDIVDTGLTMQRLLDTLGTRNPKEIHIASLLVKPDKLKVDLNIEYVAMEIPNDFIVGYGLDYDGFGRNYADIYTVVD